MLERPAPVPTLRLSRITFGLTALIVLQRGWERLLHADLWGEDGAVFLAQAIEQGARSLFIPQAGSYFTAERLVTLGALQILPLAWIPTAITAVCMAVFAFAASRIASEDYAWLIRSPFVRVATAAVFCLLPGLHEMLGNLCNLNWFLFAWLAILALRDPARPLRWRDQVVAAGVSLSIGTAILLVPLFLWRLVHAVRRRADRTTWRAEALALGILIVLGVGLPVFAGGARPPASEISSPFQVARLWYDHTARLGALTPWLGDRATTALSYRAPDVVRAAKIAVLVFFVVWTWRRRSDPAAQAVVALVLGVSAWTILAMLSRPYALPFFYEVGPWLYMSRYAFIMSFAGVVYWVVALQPASEGTGAASTALWIFLALNLILPLHRFHLPRLGAEARWAAAVPALERARARDCAEVVHVRQYPDPWTFTVRVGATSRPCADGR